MRPRERRETGEQDLFRSRLDQIIDMNHARSGADYVRAGRFALIQRLRYAHAKRFKPANRMQSQIAGQQQDGNAKVAEKYEILRT